MAIGVQHTPRTWAVPREACAPVGVDVARAKHIMLRSRNDTNTDALRLSVRSSFGSRSVSEKRNEPHETCGRTAMMIHVRAVRVSEGILRLGQNAPMRQSSFASNAYDK